MIQESKKYDRILIDIHNLYLRNHNIYKDKKQFIRPSGKYTINVGGIYGSLVSIEKLRREKLKENGFFIFLADNATSKIRTRKHIDPDYKIGRVKQRKSVYRNIDILIRILHHFDNVSSVVQIPKVEADDLVPVSLDLINEKEKGLACLLVSTDLDWSRCINYNNMKVDWFNGKEIIKPSIYLDKYGFYPKKESIIIYKSLHGDVSDSIPNPLKGMPKKELLKLVNEESILKVINNIDIYNISDKWKNEIKKNRNRLLLNEQLVSFIEISKADYLFHSVKCSFRKKTITTILNNLKLKPELLHSVIEYNKKNPKQKQWFKPTIGKRI